MNRYRKKTSRVPALLCVLLWALLLPGGCQKGDGRRGKTTDQAEAAQTQPAETDSAVDLVFLYSCDKQEWIDDVTAVFNRLAKTTDDGRTIRVLALAMEPKLDSDDPATQRGISSARTGRSVRSRPKPAPFARGHRHASAHGRGAGLARRADRLGEHPELGPRPAGMGLVGSP